VARINQDIIEYSFSKQSSLYYDLNILVGNDSIYYMITDAQFNIQVLKTVHFDLKKEKTPLSNLRDAFFDDSILKETYRSTHIVFSTPHFTLVPSKFYDDTKKMTYFKNLTNLSEADLITSDALQTEFKNVYIIDNQLYSFTKSIFPQAAVRHVFTALISGYQGIAEARQGHQLFANVRDGWVQILFFDGKDLLFANSYPFKNTGDLLYFIMLVYEQFKLNPETVPLSISGSLTEDSDIYKVIFRYIRHLQFVPTPTYVRLGNQFTGVPPHFYFDLFSIKLC
jgi:Protein of unknown function (DUF3822)